jgi:plastocyanin
MITARSARAALLVAAAWSPHSLGAQRLVEFTPNTRAAWTFGTWQPGLVLSHRFEFIANGDELLNIPLITVGTAVHERVALGLDFTSNSEVTTGDLGGNETQWWLALRGPSGPKGGVNGLLAYNTAASSLDASVTARARSRFISIVAEARGFSHAFGGEEAGFAGAGGAVLHLTPYLSLAGDAGKTFTPKDLRTVWSAGVTFAFPGTRHHFSFLATNGAAATLQGASRENVIGPKHVRYGFAFTAPLGSGSQWARIFGRHDRAIVAEPIDTGQVTVAIRNLAFGVDTVRIQAGQTVLWTNGDPIAHTVKGDDRSWGSGMVEPGQSYAHRFTSPGSYSYHCDPHPHMKGVVIVR